MLHDFLLDNRNELIVRCRMTAINRAAPKANASELEYGIPLFLDQLIRTLRVEQMSDSIQSLIISGGASGDQSDPSEIGKGAILHGRELMEHGFTIDQVVHDYGDLCQAITGLAVERGTPIDVEEFKTLNRCLDNGIADAVVEFSRAKDILLVASGLRASNQRLGTLSHELRNHLHTAMLASMAIKGGNVGLNGATSSLLDRSLVRLRDLIDLSLAEVRLAAGIGPRRQSVSIATLVADLIISASLEARNRGCQLTVSDVDTGLVVQGDPDLLFSAIQNLLQNAFKFTKKGTEVILTVRKVDDRVLMEVADHCGGMPAGIAARLFEPFTQEGDNRSGVGLGLSIARSGVEACGGTLGVRDCPGDGCIFTIELPCEV